MTTTDNTRNRLYFDPTNKRAFLMFAEGEELDVSLHSELADFLREELSPATVQFKVLSHGGKQMLTIVSNGELDSRSWQQVATKVGQHLDINVTATSREENPSAFQVLELVDTACEMFSMATNRMMRLVTQNM